MPGIARVGDSAGGTIVGALVSSVRVNGKPIACKGARVTPHDIDPHMIVAMVGASGSVFAGGIAVCRAGDSASCGHKASGEDSS